MTRAPPSNLPHVKCSCMTEVSTSLVSALRLSEASIESEEAKSARTPPPSRSPQQPTAADFAAMAAAGQDSKRNGGADAPEYRTACVTRSSQLLGLGSGALPRGSGFARAAWPRCHRRALSPHSLLAGAPSVLLCAGSSTGSTTLATTPSARPSTRCSRLCRARCLSSESAPRVAH